MSEIPIDYSPLDRAQAQFLANERGCAWYKSSDTGRPKILFVNKNTPLDEQGTNSGIFINTWSKLEAQLTVKALNTAYAMGLNKKTELPNKS